VIAEGNETPGDGSGGAAEGRGRGSESDLFSERRARRAAESGEHALTLRAEAAEATVRTLETHVASLQQRLGDSEQETRRIAELLDAERAPRHGERADAGRQPQPTRDSVLERELQRASQREYAEQRLRVEAEDRGFELDRESRAEIERLERRLSAGEREAQALTARLEIVQRDLAEAEQAAATERSAMQRTELVLRSRLSELEGTALELHGALESERAARRRAEYLLDALREAQRSALGVLAGLADTIARLRAFVSAPAEEPPAPEPVASLDTPVPALPALARELATSDPRPFARSPEPRHDAVASSTREPGVAAPSETSGAADEAVRSAEMAEALAAAVERLRARVEEHGAAPLAAVAVRPPHKHSMSLITRTKLALRRRRERRKERRAG
jgi:hypothetical protein